MGQMIKFEHNTLVLNNVFSKQDVAEIDRFAEYVRNQERERIIEELQDGGQRGYISQETYEYLVGIVNFSGYQK